MRRRTTLALAAIVLAQPTLAKDTRFWNLTSSTVRSLKLAPSGTRAFGPNQCLNDPDGAVDHDERVKVTGVAAGSYDAQLTLADGRTCLARNRNRQAVRHREQGSHRLHEVSAAH